MADYAAAVRANGSDPQARARLASLAMRTRQFDVARPQFEALLRMGYRPSRMHFGLAQIAEAQGDAAARDRWSIARRSGSSRRSPMRRRRWPGWEGDVESPILCFALAATLALTGPAKAGHYRSEATRHDRSEALGHDRSEATGHDRNEATGHDRNEAMVVAQRQITDASDAALVSPETIVEIDASKLKGDPGMLAWAPDSKALYLQMIERDRKGAVTSTKHFVIAITERTIASVDSQPAWVGPYWTWKAAPSSPATSTFKIVPSEREEIKHAMAHRNASFPAWSDDGTRIAWLERKDRRKYDLMIAGISAKS